MPHEQRLDGQQKNAQELLWTIASDLRLPYGVFFAATLVFSAASFLVPQFFLMFTENAAQISAVSIADFLPKFLLCGVLVAAALSVTSFGHSYLREWFQLKVERYLRTKILNRLHRLSSSEIDRVQRGEWLTSVTQDLRNVERFLAESLPGQLRSFLVLVGTSAVFIYYSGWMASVPILACLLIALLNVWVQKRIAPLLYEIRDIHGNVVQSLLQSLEGINTVRSYHAEKYHFRRFESQLVAVERKGLKVARTFGWLLGGNDAATQLLTTLSLTFIMVTLSKGEMALAAALAYPFYLNLFYNSAEFLASSILDWNEFMISGARVAEITQVEPMQVRRGGRRNAFAARDTIQLDLNDMSFGFDSDAPLKEKVDFTIRRGEIVAVLGPSGAGKSTFLEVMSGLRPAFSGRWQIRNSTHQMHRSFMQEALPLDLVTYVEQKPYIFAGSVRDNLLFGGTCEEEVLRQALSDVNLTDFLRENGGIEYEIQDRGQNVSEGERYRLALARAILQPRPFLALDEPFAALDHKNTALVIEALHQRKQDCGIVLVTHVIPEGLNPDRIIDFSALHAPMKSAEIFLESFPQTDNVCGLHIHGPQDHNV